MLRHILVIITIAISMRAATGQTFDVTPGQLAADRSVPSHATTISVRGSIDASDLAYLASAIEECVTLDLSGASIAGYNGKKIGFNTFKAKANTLPSYIFAGLRVSHLKLPSTIVAIGIGALIDSKISDVAIPAGVTEVGAYAFAECKSLTGIEIPEGVDCIGDNTFEGCESLGTVSLPMTVKKIGRRVFLRCRELKNIDMPSGLTDLGDEAFAASGLNMIDLSGCKQLKTIGTRAFSSCTHLKEARMPSGSATLGQGVFFECGSLTSVSLPSETVTLPPLTFKGNVNISEIELPESITEIGALAMADMKSVSKITLPPSLNHIGDWAFEGWTGVSEINARELSGVPTLGEDVWAGVDQPDVVLNVGKDMGDAYLAAPQWQDFDIIHSSVDRIAADNIPGSEITARFDGNLLKINSPVNLRRVIVYTTDGRVASLTDNIRSTDLTVDMTGHGGAFFIVKADCHGDINCQTFKLMRSL